MAAADQWVRDYEKAHKNASSLAREVHQQQNGDRKVEARQSALLRGKMASLRQDVSHLEQALMASSQNTQAYGVTRKELARRGDLLAKLSEQAEGIQEAVRTGVRRRLESSEQQPSGRDTPWAREGRGGRDDPEAGASGRDLLALGEQEIEQQDESLDFLHGCVSNLKNMGGDISNEIDLHCKLLGDMEDQTGSQISKIKQQVARFGILTEQGANCSLWLCICVQSVTLFVLLVFF